MARNLVTNLVIIHLFVWRTFRVKTAVDSAISSGHIESGGILLEADHCVLTHMAILHTQNNVRNTLHTPHNY